MALAIEQQNRIEGEDRSRQDIPIPEEQVRWLRQIATESLDLLKAGDHEKARVHLECASALARQEPTGSYFFGLFHFNIGEFTTALEWFDCALTLNPSSKPALSGRADVLQKLDRPLEALISLETILTLDPTNQEALYKSATIFQCLNRNDEALLAYEAILQTDPRHVAALVARGMLLEKLGHLEEALPDFDAADFQKPNDLLISVSRACILIKLGRIEAALRVYERLRRHGWNDPHICHGHGLVLQRLHRFEEALERFDACLERNPQHAGAMISRAICLYLQRRLDEALEAYDAVLAIDPENPDTISRRGVVLFELNRFDEALTAYNEALKLRPNFLLAHLNRAHLYVHQAHLCFKQGRLPLAIAACAAALNEVPDDPQALCLRGIVLAKFGNLDAALASVDRSLQLRPANHGAWLNRGYVLQELDRLEEAHASYEMSVLLKPGLAIGLSNRGVTEIELNRPDAALASFDDAIKSEPDFADAHNNRAVALLLKGEMQTGFAEFEYRWQRQYAAPRRLESTRPVWCGESLAGRRIVVYDEQGLGDLIQFSRYFPLLADLGAEVMFIGREQMFRLLGTLRKPPHCVETIADLGDYDYQIALMSLPLPFETGLDTVPAQIPYLAAEAERVAAWGARLGKHGFRIGICTHGRPKINLRRTVPLSFFGPIAAIPGVRLISLMKEESDDTTRESLAAVSIETLGEDYDAGPAAFLDAAAVMANCDLVITSDTSIAHLAGALGIETCLALRHVPDWRWQLEGETSPWYPSLRLFRQPRRGEWTPVFEAVKAHVEQRLAERNMLPFGQEVAVPITAGELIDKITSLQIKMERITDPEESRHINYELSKLLKAKQNISFGGNEITALESEMKTINKKLRDIEEALLRHEERSDFGAEFVELARSVYQTSRRRADLKKTINLLLNSRIIEEKFYG